MFLLQINNKRSLLQTVLKLAAFFLRYFLRVFIICGARTENIVYIGFFKLYLPKIKSQLSSALELEICIVIS